MDNQPSRLVHDKEKVVFIEDLKRDRFRLDFKWGWRWNLNGNSLIGLDPMGSLRGSAVDLDIPLPDQPLDGCAGLHRKNPR